MMLLGSLYKLFKNAFEAETGLVFMREICVKLYSNVSKIDDHIAHLVEPKMLDLIKGITLILSATKFKAGY